jgi:hypothetical protein
MGETQHRRVARPRERVERRCFHLDGEDAQRPGARDGRGRFPKRRIGCPARPGKDLQPLALQRVYRDGDELRVRLGECAGRGIVVAGALVSERGR